MNMFFDKVVKEIQAMAFEAEKVGLVADEIIIPLCQGPCVPHPVIIRFEVAFFRLS